LKELFSEVTKELEDKSDTPEEIIQDAAATGNLFEVLNYNPDRPDRPLATT